MGLIIWIMLAVGLVLLWRGWRGVPVLSEPRCAKCRYDLRTVRYDAGPPTRCPECGADLTPRRAVRFGAHRKRPGMLIGGAVLAGIPLLLIGVAMLGVSLDWRRYRPNSWVIADLATTADIPWNWRVLEDRYQAGGLDRAEVRQAIDQLIAHLHQQHAAGHGAQPLHWSDQFVEAVERGGDLTAEQYEDLCRAFYDNGPTLQAQARVRVGEPIVFSLDYGGHWDLPDRQFVKALREVRGPNGQPLTVRADDAHGHESDNPDWLSHTGVWAVAGKVLHDLPPGEHELTFVVDAGVLPQGAPLVGVQGRPGQKRRWPRPVASWTSEVVYTVEVLPAGAARIELVTDPALKPTLSPPGLRVGLTGSGESWLGVVWGSRAERMPVAVSFDVALVTPAGEQRVGSLMMTPAGRQRFTSQTRITPLPADVDKVGLILRPNPKHAEDIIGADRVWGEEIVFEDVPVSRGDR